MNRRARTTHCLMSGNLPDLVSSLKAGLEVTTVVVCVALLALTVVWLIIGN